MLFRVVYSHGTSERGTTSSQGVSMRKITANYRILLVLLVVLSLLPQAYVLFQLGRIVYLTGHYPFLYPSIPGLSGGNTHYSDFSHATMWRGLFVNLVPDFNKIRARSSAGMTVVNDYVLRFTDPLTGKQVGSDVALKSGYYRPIGLDDRLFLVGSPTAQKVVSESYEFIENKLVPFDFIWPQYAPMVLIQDKLFRIENLPATSKPEVSTVESGVWASRDIVLAGFIKQIDTRADFAAKEDSFLLCLNDGKKIYTFVRSDGKVYFRPGLPLRSSADPNQIQTYGLDETDHPADGDSGPGWQLVQTKANTVPVSHSSDFAIANGGPMALIVEKGGDPHRRVGHLYQYERDEWNELTAIQFPFGSESFRLISGGNGLAPFIVATTSTGTSFVYQWESGKIREVPGQGPQFTWSIVKNGINHHVAQYAIILGLGLLPCLTIWLLNQWRTSSTYSFGAQTARLASLGQRGMARGIDLSLLVVLSVIVARSQLSKVNWIEVAESLNLKLAHPDITIIIQTFYVEAIVITIACLVLTVIQGIWGITPGKWLCGLRTLRTTLRPCGIARSLVRELLLAIDSTYLLCWIPGSLAIGLTERRQRIGDLLGDTIVVTSQSMKSERRKDNDTHIRSFNP